MSSSKVGGSRSLSKVQGSSTRCLSIPVIPCQSETGAGQHLIGVGVAEFPQRRPTLARLFPSKLKTSGEGKRRLSTFEGPPMTQQSSVCGVRPQVAQGLGISQEDLAPAGSDSRPLYTDEELKVRYDKVAVITKDLKRLKVVKREMPRSAFDPNSVVAGIAKDTLHPFQGAQLKTFRRMSRSEQLCEEYVRRSKPENEAIFEHYLLGIPTRRGKHHNVPKFVTAFNKESVRSRYLELAAMRKQQTAVKPQKSRSQMGEKEKRLTAMGRSLTAESSGTSIMPSMSVSDSVRGSRSLISSRRGSDSSKDIWTSVKEKEYLLYSKLFQKLRRRRSEIIMTRWRKALTILNIFRRFCLIMKRVSQEKEAEFKTFTTIGDQGSGTEPTGNIPLMETRPKYDHSELRLSTKAQTIMCHPPETRTKNEVTLCLCDLQCYMSFCQYPLEIQYKIAEWGMFLPVEQKRVIVRQGHDPENWYFVISGQAIETEITYKEDGTMVPNTLKVISPGDTFGEEAIVENTKQPYTVTSRRSMQLVRVTKEHFEAVFLAARLHAGDTPKHILYLRAQKFMSGFPVDLLLKHPTMCYQKYARPNTLLVKNSEESEWIYLIHAGTCAVYMLIDSTRASWRDLQLGLAHPTINIDGEPYPKIRTEGRKPQRKTTYTLFRRMSASEIEGSDLNEVPALHMTREGCKNIHHGLYMLGGGRNMRCPWPLNFLGAMNRTAFPIYEKGKGFPVEARKLSTSFNPHVTISCEKRESEERKSEDRECEERNTNYPVDDDEGSDANDNDESEATSGEEARRRRVTRPKVDRVFNWSGTGTLEDLFTPLNVMTEEQFNQMTGQEPPNKQPGGSGKKGRDRSSSNRHPFNYNLNADGNVSSRGSMVNASRSVVWSSLEAKETASETAPKEKPTHSSKKLKFARGSKAGPNHPVQPAKSKPKVYKVPSNLKPTKPKSKKNTLSAYECLSPPVYIQIERIGAGDVFGLDQLKEPGWEDREQSGRVALVSKGAEVVMVNKQFFMKLARAQTIMTLGELMRIYPTRKEVQMRFRLQLAWDLYCKKTQDEFFEDQRNIGNHASGIFFQQPPAKSKDPYVLMKEVEEEELND